MLDKDLKARLLRLIGPGEITSTELVQSLWSGYGQILRTKLKSCEYESLIVKHVNPPNTNNHPRGWNSDISHQRKLKSYRVESSWYKDFSALCPKMAPVPKLIACEQNDDDFLIVLEDMDAIGFPKRLSTINQISLEACLTWLAHFHAKFLHKQSTGLWESGSYWHLETRPDELEVLDDLPLKKAAKAIDHKLKSSPFQTIIHGDAKLANFCFSPDASHVAAVDFQYVGHGCGMKDLAYFIGSCLHEEDCESMEKEILNFYFCELSKACTLYQKQVDLNELENNWRELYHYAWADFHRFLKGWSPGHWKINSYSERICRQVIQELNS